VRRTGVMDSEGRAGVLDGYWLPAGIRRILCEECDWETVALKGGAFVHPNDDGAVRIRWPRLTDGQWETLLDRLQKARRLHSRELLDRWVGAFARVQEMLDVRMAEVLPTLSQCCGYAPEMIRAALALGDIISPRQLAAAMEFRPTWSITDTWEQIHRVPGTITFVPRHSLHSLWGRLRSRSPVFRIEPPVDVTIGWAAGNVPGIGIMLGLLGILPNYDAPRREPAPAVLVRNSRHEPLFTPFVLGAVEEVDPDLVANIAVLTWEHTDEALLGRLMSRAGVMIAAAGDEAIATLDALRRTRAPSLRFHPHGHKVSFAVVDADMRFSPIPELTADTGDELRMLSLLASADSTMWDQNGCLSARVHFVAGDADRYAEQLCESMRAISTRLPPGAVPRRLVHRAFDSCAVFGAAPLCRAISTYEDGFAVVVDRRRWDAEMLRQAVNMCAGRVVVVRPIPSVMDAVSCLRLLPRGHLQSVSIGMRMDPAMEFAESVARRGISSIRCLGRAAFPHLAHSWDGLVPADMARRRPAGWFTSIEFDSILSDLRTAHSRLREVLGVA